MKNLIDPEKLRAIATFMDTAFPQDQNREMQAYLRQTADNVLGLQERLLQAEVARDLAEHRREILAGDARRLCAVWESWSALPTAVTVPWAGNHKLTAANYAPLAAHMDRLGHCLAELA